MQGNKGYGVCCAFFFVFSSSMAMACFCVFSSRVVSETLDFDRLLLAANVVVVVYFSLPVEPTHAESDVESHGLTPYLDRGRQSIRSTSRGWMRRVLAR